jgi:putative inorganic carbon (hco3(-)) transporter
VLYITTLVYVALVYLRPADLFAAMADVPVVLISSMVAAPALGLAILNDPRRLLTLPNDRYLFGLWVAITASCLAAGWFAGALAGFAQFGQIVFLYVLVRYAIGDDRQFRGLVLLLISVVLVQAVSGIVQMYTGTGLGGIARLDIEGTRRIRGAGIFNDPNDLALTFVTVVPFLAALATEKAAGMTRRILIALSLVTILLALYFTNSRGGIVALGASLIVLAYRRFGRWIASVATVIGLLTIVALGPSRINEIQTNEESAQGRFVAWSEGLQMLKSHPVLGVGWSRFTDFHEQVAHNSFVHIVAETGLIGGFFFIGLIYFYFTSLGVARATSLPPPAAADWTNALIASGVGLFTGAAFLSHQYSPAFYTVVALGSTYAGLRGAGAVFESRQPGAGLFDAAIVAGFEVLAIAGVYAAVVAFAVWGR